MLLNTTAPSDNTSTCDIAMPTSPLNDANPVKAKSAKKAAPKKAVKKKAAPKKVAAKKAAAPKAVKAIVVKPAKKQAKPVKAPNSAIFLEKEAYKSLISGLMDQGIEHGDAVDTIKVGLRQANGIPVPMTLMMAAG